MKRVCVCLLLVLCLAGASARADVIWEPMDPFYLSHRAECTEVDQLWEAQVDTALYDKPGGTVKESVSAGDSVYISNLWSGGWGQMPWRDYWTNLADYRRLYDIHDFEAAHRADFVREEHVLTMEEDVFLLDGQALEGQTEDSSLILWTYPVSGKKSRAFSRDEFDRAIRMTANPCWQDAEGRLWGYASGYLFGSFEGWICLSDPLNGEIPAEGPKYADEAPQDPAPEETEAPVAGGLRSPGNGSGPSLMLPAALVLAAVLTAALSLYRMRRRSVKAA